MGLFAVTEKKSSGLLGLGWESSFWLYPLKSGSGDLVVWSPSPLREECHIPLECWVVLLLKNGAIAVGSNLPSLGVRSAEMWPENQRLSQEGLLSVRVAHSL